jgi:hypothetical protein
VTPLDFKGDEVDRIHGWGRWSATGSQGPYRDAIAKSEGRLYVRVGGEERLMWGHPWRGVGTVGEVGGRAVLFKSDPCMDCNYPADWHYPDWTLGEQA